MHGATAHPSPRARLAQVCAAWWPPALLLLLPMLLFRQGIGGGTPPFGGDVVVLNYPLLTLIQRQLGQGLLPLWNTYAGGGYPLIPFSALAFYPPIWLLHWLSVDDTIGLLTAFDFALGGLGAYRLSGVTGAGRPARVVGATAFLLSGALLGHLYAGHLLELGVIGWMPWVFHAAHRLVERPSLRGAVILGALGGLQILANGIGFLVFTLYPVGALLLIGLLRAARAGGTPGALRVLALPPLSVAVAGALSAVLALPFLQALGQSIRAGGLDLAGASKTSLHPAALLMALSPDALGDGPHDSYWLSDLVKDFYWHELALYVGLVPLLGSCLACLYCRRTPWVRCYGALALLGLILALGRYTPIYGLAFRTLPGLNLVRAPARWLLVSTLAAAVLAPVGVEWLLAQRQGGRALLRALRLPLLGGGLLAAALTILLQGVYILQTGRWEWQPHFAQTLWPAATRLLIFGGLLALILAIHAERLIRSSAAAWLLLAFNLLDLWVAASGSIRFQDPATVYAPTTLGALVRPGDETYRIYTADRSLPNRQGMVDGSLYDAEDFAPVTLRDYWKVTHPKEWALMQRGQVSNASARDLIFCYDPTFGHLMGIGVLTFAAPFSSLRLCRPLKGSAGLTLQSAVPTQLWLLPNGKSWNPTPFWSISYVYRNDRALPRASLLPLAAARLLPDHQAQFRAVTTEGFDGTRTLLLDPRPAEAPAGLGWLQDRWADALRPAPLPLPSLLAPGATQVLTDTSNSVQVAVNATAASYLLLDDAYYPGWGAAIDGRPAPILRADFALRAVAVPAGRHMVVFSYAPLSYLAGMAITMAAAAGVLLYLLWPRLHLPRPLQLPRPRQRRRAAAPSPSTPLPRGGEGSSAPSPPTPRPGAGEESNMAPLASPEPAEGPKTPEV